MPFSCLVLLIALGIIVIPIILFCWFLYIMDKEIDLNKLEEENQEPLNN